MVLNREHDPFSGHRPVVPVQDFYITPLDVEGQPSGERMHVLTPATVDLGPLWPLPAISTTLDEPPPTLAQRAQEALESMGAGEPPAEPTPAPQAATQPVKPARKPRRRSTRRKPSQDEMDAALREMDR